MLKDVPVGGPKIAANSSGGNIIAGKDVKISGMSNGGEVKAVGKIFVNGKFNGKLEGNDVEIGANSSGSGEILYNDYISISRGAKIDVQISQTREALKEVKAPAQTKATDTKPVQQKIEGTRITFFVNRRPES